jgi:hypothetical protein
MMSPEYSIKVQGYDRIIEKLDRWAKDADRLIQQAVARVTMLGKGMIADKITQLDLVDTGHYRGNWQVSQIGTYTWKLATNTEYALMLEFGLHKQVNVKEHQRTSKKGTTYTVQAHLREVNRDGYNVVQDTAVKMRLKLATALRKALEEARPK